MMLIHLQTEQDSGRSVVFFEVGSGRANLLKNIYTVMFFTITGRKQQRSRI